MHTFNWVPGVLWVSLSSVSVLPVCMACLIQPRNVDLELNDLYRKFLPQRFNFSSFNVAGLTTFSGVGGLQNIKKNPNLCSSLSFGFKPQYQIRH